MQQTAYFKAWVSLNISHFMFCFCSADVVKRALALNPRNLGTKRLTFSSFCGPEHFNS